MISQICSKERVPGNESEGTELGEYCVHVPNHVVSSAKSVETCMEKWLIAVVCFILVAVRIFHLPGVGQ